MSQSVSPSLPPRRATLKDVARAAGVSQSTTSRALSGEGYVASAVRQRVLTAADELGYVPHAMARSLRKQVTQSIGVIVSDLRNPFYAELAAGVSSRARSKGYTMMLVDDEGIAEEELAAAEAFVGTRTAGVIVTPLSADVSTYLLKHHIPVVEVDRQFSAGKCDGVVVDNEKIARQVTDHLVALGHRRIALVIDETNWTTGSERFSGYQRSLDDAGITADPSLVVTAGWDVDAARNAAVNALARRDPPTAVFAANNLLAEGVWRAANDLGLRIPHDISVVSFDDARWMTMVSPGITAVVQDAAKLGETAMDRLLERIDEPHAPPTTVVLDSQFVPRRSTAGPRRP
ncbi:LacI family DNA-binding transcriptional regulator [Okibacterium endophyticum]